MRKILVILLFLLTLTSMVTGAGIASQRNAWKKEAEESWKKQLRLEEKYDAYKQEAEEEIDALTIERDAYSLLTEAMEAENIALHQEIDQLNQQLQDTTAALEAQLAQAQADQAFAEQRLQEVMDVLLTPAPSSTPQPSPQPEGKNAALSEEEISSFASFVAEQLLHAPDEAAAEDEAPALEAQQ